MFSVLPQLSSKVREPAGGPHSLSILGRAQWQGVGCVCVPLDMLNPAGAAFSSVDLITVKADIWPLPGSPVLLFVPKPGQGGCGVLNSFSASNFLLADRG